MLDFIKTLILGIWIDKKYRYIFLFILVTLIYRFMLWVAVLSIYEMSPVEFVKINDNGSLTFIYAKKNKETIRPDEYQLPTKNGHKNKKYDIKNVKDTKQCESDFFELYKHAVNNLLRSSEDKKFILKIKRKFPINIGEVTYFDRENIEKPIFKTLYEQGFIFDKSREIDYCKELKKFK